MPPGRDRSRYFGAQADVVRMRSIFSRPMISSASRTRKRRDDFITGVDQHPFIVEAVSGRPRHEEPLPSLALAEQHPHPSKDDTCPPTNEDESSAAPARAGARFRPARSTRQAPSARDGPQRIAQASRLAPGSCAPRHTKNDREGGSPLKGSGPPPRPARDLAGVTVDGKTVRPPSAPACFASTAAAT